MTTTYHPGGLTATSNPDDDLVGLSLHDVIDFVVEKDVLVAIAAQHATERPNPRYGESRFRSADAQILAARADTARAEAEVERLRRALQHVKALGDGARYVAGTPLSLYATAALNGATD